MKKILVLASAVLVLAACGNKPTPTDVVNNITTTAANNLPSIPAVVAAGITAADFATKIVDAKGVPVTWENAAKEIIFFRTDGTLGGQGDGGEETMYEGTWKIEGGALVITADKNGGVHEVKFEGDKMILAGAEYHVVVF